jgi:hypothetical protein
MKFEYHTAKEFDALETVKRGVTAEQFVTGLHKIDSPEKLLPWLREANTVKVDTVDSRVLVFTRDLAKTPGKPANSIDATAKLKYELDLIEDSPAYEKIDTTKDALETALTAAIPDSKVSVLQIEEDFVDTDKNAQLAELLTNPKKNLFLFNFKEHFGVVSTDVDEKEFYAGVKKFARALPKAPEVG